MAQRQIDKLLAIAAQEDVLIKHEIKIKGQDLTFWSRPMKICEYQAAKQASKNPDDMLETAARLFIRKALDASGQPQYQSDALPFLMNVLSMETASQLMGAINDSEEEEDMDLDVKSPEGTAKKGAKPTN